MSTAVIISGQMRTFNICYPSQKWFVYRHYPDLHFFVYCYQDDQTPLASLLKSDYKNVHIGVTEAPDLKDIPSWRAIGLPYGNSVSHPDIMRQHWINSEAWKFFLANGGDNEFDTVIRTRSDLYFHRFAPVYPTRKQCFTPWWGRFGGVNDRFAVMGFEAAKHYYSVFDHIDELGTRGCPFHPETMVATMLESVESRPTLVAEFSTARMDGTQRWPELSLSDMVQFISAV